VEALELVGATDASGHWTGGDLVLVQTGDRLDRGDEEEAIEERLLALREEARRKGGEIHLLLGNHEMMNTLGDYRYVTPGALSAFQGPGPRSPRASRAPLPLQARAAVFLPGGSMALRTAELPAVLVVGDTVFAHAGVREFCAGTDFDELHAQNARYLQGSGAPPELLLHEEGPLWTRAYGHEVVPPAVCEELGRVLERLAAKRMVVGHTVQERGITSACDGRLFRIDVGLSRYYGGHKVEALVQDERGVRVVTAPRRAP